MDNCKYIPRFGPNAGKRCNSKCKLNDVFCLDHRILHDISKIELPFRK